MRITRLTLTDVKRHASLDLHPAAGLTIVRGPNEAGKSTIHEALALVLFRKADSNREDVRALHRWGTDALPEVALEFEVDGQPGRLVKRFGGPRAEALLSFEDEMIRDPARIQDEVAELTGIPDDAFYQATASVGHAELGELQGGAPAISDRLQKAISGAERGTGRAKKKLEQAVHRYRTEGAKNPGLLKAIREDIAALETSLAAEEQGLARLEADRAQWADAHARREALDAELATLQADLAEATRAADFAAQRDAAQARYEQYRRASELVAQVEELERDRPTSVPLAALRTAVSRAGVIEDDLSEAGAELDVDTEIASQDEALSAPPSPRPWLVVAIAALVIGALAGAMLPGQMGAAALAAGGLVAIVTLARAFLLATRVRHVGLAREMAEEKAASHREMLHEQEDRFRRRRRELQQLLEEVRMPDVETARTALAALEEQTEQLAHTEGELRGLGVVERDAQRLAQERDQAAAAAERAAHALAAMGDLGRDPAASRGAAQRRVDATAPRRDQARSEEDQAQGRLDADRSDAEQVAALAERLATARAREVQLLGRVVLYEATLHAIVEAERATLKTAARYLEEHMGPAVERVTGGRYREVHVDERSLAFRVRAPESGALVDVGQLSRGTADELFLAARLGLVRLVTMDRRPPIILDDPFVTFDADRAEQALALLKDVAAEQGFQVILLTCSDRFDAAADELVVLEAPSTEAVAPLPDDPVVTAAAVPRPATEPAPADVAAPTAVPTTPTASTTDTAPALTTAAAAQPVTPAPVAARSAGSPPAPSAGAVSDSPDPVSGVVDPFRLAERPPADPREPGGAGTTTAGLGGLFDRLPPEEPS